MARGIDKYLARWAAPSVRLVDWLERSHDAAVCIPAFGEADDVLHALLSVVETGASALVIVVVNAPDDASPAALASNRASRRAIAGHFGVPDPGESAVGFIATKRSTIVLADTRVPRKEGVGAARKYGLDFLCAAHRAGRVRDRFLHTTDADVRVPATYFDAARAAAAEHPNAAALVHRFTHVSDIAGADAAEHDNVLRYECRLRHHVLGLRWAGSPYAHHAIGSTMALDTHRYAQVRGMPRRAAGEDFYVLGKLAKLGPIVPVDGDPIVLSGRPSHRVPFGTGRAIKNARDSGEHVRCYNPAVFVGLRAAIDALARAIMDERRFDPDTLQAPGMDDTALRAAARETRLADVVDDVLAQPWDTERRLARLHDRFDAFATLKFLHALRGGGYPDMDVARALRESPFCAGLDGALPTWPTQLEALERASHVKNVSKLPKNPC